MDIRKMTYLEIIQITFGNHPNTTFSMTDPTDLSTLTWASEDLDKPTQEILDEAETRIRSQYALRRTREYPTMEEQLDYIYHNGVESWKTNMITPIKTKYPKPE
jgi:hypothetical protein|tara:strand:- start:48 stop:359 length:312 start_codon:yes stop_codon:yes gene_type:complete